jgi:hypothetical protein
MGWLPGSGTDGLAARIWYWWAGCQDLGQMGWLPGSSRWLNQMTVYDDWQDQLTHKIRFLEGSGRVAYCVSWLERSADRQDEAV